MESEDKLSKAISKIDNEIERRKDVNSYASTFTSEDAGKIEGLILARKLIKGDVWDLYPDGLCPDCFTPIPLDAGIGDKCPNCGHVWTEDKETDMQITEDKKMEEMIEQLSPVEKMVNQYFTLEEKILKEIEKLPNHGKECDCDEPNRFCVVDDDNLACMCLHCGGFISW